MRHLFAALFLAAFVGFVLSPSVGAESAGSTADLIKSTCVNCHGLGRICNSQGKPEGYWKTQMMLMIKQWGMKDPGEDAQKAIIDYLSGLEAGDESLCAK